MPHELLPNAVGLNSTSFNGARLIGPGVAGLLVAEAKIGDVVETVEATGTLRPVRLVAVGAQASRIVGDLVPAATHVVTMRAWASSAAVLADWRRALDELKPLAYPKDLPASFTWDGLCNRERLHPG